jgi:hypothetical protein
MRAEHRPRLSLLDLGIRIKLSCYTMDSVRPVRSLPGFGTHYQVEATSARAPGATMSSILLRKWHIKRRSVHLAWRSGITSCAARDRP